MVIFQLFHYKNCDETSFDQYRVNLLLEHIFTVDFWGQKNHFFSYHWMMIRKGFSWMLLVTHLLTIWFYNKYYPNHPEHIYFNHENCKTKIIPSYATNTEPVKIPKRKPYRELIIQIA